MSNLLHQFRSFYFRNYPNDMQTQIEYFAVFGGMDIDLDTTLPIATAIQNHILKNFHTINTQMQEITKHHEKSKKLLHAIAVGDRKIFSAFNKAGFNNTNGGITINQLYNDGVIDIEYSREKNPKKEKNHTKLKREIARHRISHKIVFTKPFIRFWFYFISPYTKEIAQNKYTNFFKQFLQKQNSYTSFVFEELCEILLNYHLRDSQIISSGSYWDANVEIDILTVTQDNKIYVAECKWTNHKINKNELTKLLEKCEKIGVKPTQIALFCKSGFSKELMSMQGKDVALYSACDFEKLLKRF